MEKSKYLRNLYNKSKPIVLTFAVGIYVGQYHQPIPFDKRSALPSIVGEALPNLDFVDDDFGYTQDFRDNMDKLVKSSVKPERK